MRGNRPGARLVRTASGQLLARRSTTCRSALLLFLLAPCPRDQFLRFLPPLSAAAGYHASLHDEHPRPNSGVGRDLRATAKVAGVETYSCTFLTRPCGLCGPPRVPRPRTAPNSLQHAPQGASAGPYSQNGGVVSRSRMRGAAGPAGSRRWARRGAAAIARAACAAVLQQRALPPPLPPSLNRPPLPAAAGPSSSGAAGASSHPARPVIQQQSEFAKRASQIGLAIHKTSLKLQKLAQLAKRTSMFDDPSAEIDELTGIIKHDIQVSYIYA